MNAKILALAVWLGLTTATPTPQPVNPPVLCLKTCFMSATGLTALEGYEGYVPFIYLDVAGIPTLGFGHVVKHGETFPQPLLPEDASVLLRSDIRFAESGLNRYVAEPLFQHQADPTISLVFNIGVGNFSKSTLLKKMNAGAHSEVPAEFLKWHYAGGKDIPGLLNRRKAEAAMYQGQ